MDMKGGPVSVLKYGYEGRTYIIDGFEQLNHISTHFKVNPIYRVGGRHSISPVVVEAATTKVYWRGGGHKTSSQI